MSDSLLNSLCIRNHAKSLSALFGIAFAVGMARGALAADVDVFASLAAGMQPPAVQQGDTAERVAAEAPAFGAAEPANAPSEDVAVTSRGRVVIFASEKIGDEWISSYFNAIPEGGAGYNQCELSLGKTFSALGYEMADEGLTKHQRAEARRLRTVFRRYRDMSSMANDTAVKASDIVDASAEAVVLCTADVGVRSRWRKQRFKSCAEVKCKAISTANSRRLVTHSIERCAAGPGETAASVEAIRSVCSDAGRAMGEKLVLNEGDGL
jgi:hypothetical protein